MKGSIRQRSKGTWELRYDMLNAETGKRRQLGETVRGTKKEAERVLRDRLSALESGSYVEKQNETVTEFMARWMDIYAVTNIGLRTQEGYQGLIKRNISPSLGKIALQNLTPRHVQSMYAELLNRGLSARTVRDTHVLLRQALGHAVRWGIVPRNVADATTPPRRQKKEMAMWEVETIDRFLEAAEGSRFGDFYHLALLTGMRRSELAGLKWQDVDLPNCQLSVVRTSQRIKGHGLVEGQPKTARSRRSIALAPETIDLLHSIRGKQIEQRLEAGEFWQSTGYVFTRTLGEPVEPYKVSGGFLAIVRDFGLPHLTLHGLRHAHATLSLIAGVNPKIVSERLGHSTVAMTMDTYSHVIPGLQEGAALAVEQLLAEAKKKRQQSS